MPFMKLCQLGPFNLTLLCLFEFVCLSIFLLSLPHIAIAQHRFIPILNWVDLVVIRITLFFCWLGMFKSALCLLKIYISKLLLYPKKCFYIENRRAYDYIAANIFCLCFTFTSRIIFLSAVDDFRFALVIHLRHESRHENGFLLQCTIRCERLWKSPMK